MLTPRQFEAHTLICGRIAAGQPAPSYREIAARLDTTVSGAHRLVHGLIGRHFLAREPGRLRSLTPLRWPDGRSFDPNERARVEALIATYENGRQAGREGRLAEPNPCIGEHTAAWRLGHAAGARARATHPRLSRHERSR